MSDIITAENLQLWYGDTHALKGIDMAIPEKNITALIGPSGCGKSTFLKTLNRMNDLIPSVRITGEVRYNGRSIFDKDVDVCALRRDIGMVFQKPNPFPMRTLPTVPVLTGPPLKKSWMRSWSRPCGTRPSGTR